MRWTPIGADALVDELADRVSALPATTWARVVIDGAAPADPGRLADAMVDPLRVRGRPVLRVSAADFLRPASLRLERGRHDPDARYEDWLDTDGLVREALRPLDPGGTGRVLPSLWDAERDRASRAGYVRLPRDGVLLLDGELLLGRHLPVELSVHLWLSAPALARNLPAARRWSVPAYARYEREVDPARAADVAVRVDHPDRPAIRRKVNG